MADPIKPYRPIRPDASSVSRTPRPTPGLFDLLRQMLEPIDSPLMVGDPILQPKQTGLPLFQNEPWADSLQVALGVRPSRTRYIDNPYAEGATGKTFTHNYPERNAVANEVWVAPNRPRSDVQHTYAHELSHVYDNVNQVSPRKPDELAERRALGWERWSGRAPRWDRTESNAEARGYPQRITDYEINETAKWLAARFDSAMKARSGKR